MKIQFPLLALIAMSLAACNDGTSTTSTTTDTAMAPVSDPNMVTTTTTTTTTRPAFQPKPNVQYMDLRTRKMVTVRVDTVHHYIVNTVTNQPVDWLVEPGTTDTVYGRNMQTANGYINYGAGSDWKYDESLGSSNTNSTSGTDMNSSSGSGTDMNSTSNTTDNSSATTTGTDNSGGIRKMKTNGNETKIKMDDGSKIKTNGNETKIKNK